MKLKILNAVLCLLLISYVGSAKIIEVAPANAKMTTMIVGGGGGVAAGGAASGTYDFTSDVGYAGTVYKTGWSNCSGADCYAEIDTDRQPTDSSSDWLDVQYSVASQCTTYITLKTDTISGTISTVRLWLEGKEISDPTYSEVFISNDGSTWETRWRHSDWGTSTVWDSNDWSVSYADDPIYLRLCVDYVGSISNMQYSGAYVIVNP